MNNQYLSSIFRTLILMYSPFFSDLISHILILVRFYFLLFLYTCKHFDRAPFNDFFCPLLTLAFCPMLNDWKQSDTKSEFLSFSLVSSSPIPVFLFSHFWIPAFSSISALLCLFAIVARQRTTNLE